MRTLFAIDPWKLVETQLHPDDMRLAESLLSIGNAHIGMRGNFEEAYGGACHRGTYLAGCWFPDKARVESRKLGYPEYFAKIINAVDLLEIGVSVDGEPIDLSSLKVVDFYRELDMEHGLLLRRFTVALEKGTITAEVERFLSLERKELLAIRYRVTPSFSAEVAFFPALDANVRNENSNHGEAFFEPVAQGYQSGGAHVIARTRENPFGAPRFTVCAAMRAPGLPGGCAAAGRVEVQSRQSVQAGETAELIKLVCVDTSRNHEDDAALKKHVRRVLDAANKAGFSALLDEQRAAWRDRWDDMDVRIDGDDGTQQGIRFSLFQLLCAYDGTDPRLSISSRGLTGEKYGGATCWDAEMFCLPVILSVLGEDTAKSLLKYRYLHLDKAKENAAKLGCAGALYPMATVDGEECHDEWEVAFCSVHRNAAVFYAIFFTFEYCGDAQYLREYGLPVMLEICRYWVSRVTWHAKKRAYMILCVTGPNEYDININNNWYTNRMAKFCLEETARFVRATIGITQAKTIGTTEREIARFERVAAKLYLPEDKRLGIFVQHDGFLDKEIVPAAALDPSERPLSEHWSWDRILRSCCIKQADVLLGLYCLRHLYGRETIARNFSFYEPLTAHEGSLSPCIHALLAADVGEYEKAAELFRRAARLDLDNINNDTQDGLNITSMCGSWMTVVKGFAGMRTELGVLELSPRVPRAFQSFAFKLRLQGRLINVEVFSGTLSITLCSGPAIMVKVYDVWRALPLGKQIVEPVREMEGLK